MTTSGVLGQVMRITVHQKNNVSSRETALLHGQTIINQLHVLGEHQIAKHVRDLKSAMALHHSINKVKFK